MFEIEPQFSLFVGRVAGFQKVPECFRALDLWPHLAQFPFTINLQLLN